MRNTAASAESLVRSLPYGNLDAQIDDAFELATSHGLSLALGDDVWQFVLTYLTTGEEII